MHSYKHYHRVYYNETDQMSRVYHSNYLIWMEEARTEWFKNIGLNYKDIEASGFLLPVRNLSIEYLKGVEYDEKVCIRVFAININRIKVEFQYEFYSEDESTLFARSSSINVFTDKNGTPNRISKELFDRIVKGA